MVESTVSLASARPAAALPHPLIVVGAGAMVAGGGEFLLRTAARTFSDRPVLLDPASSWAGPLSALAVISIVALIVWLLFRSRGAATARKSVIVVVAFVVAFDFLMFADRLHEYARLILAAGGASICLGVAARFPRIVSRLLSVAAASLLVVCGAAAARTVWSNRAGEPPAGSEGPNVILLVLDTVRALELGAYGFARATSPNLDRLAADGITFDRAVATAPWTLATHATLFTGRYQFELDVGWATPLEAGPLTLAEVFGARGYATGGFVANLRYCTRDFGLARGFQTYRDYAVSPSQIIGSTMLGRRMIRAWNTVAGDHVLPGRKSASTVVDEFLEWQSSVGTGSFFAFLNVFDAHEPYDPPTPFDSMLVRGDPPTRSIEPDRAYSPGDIAQLRDAYDGAIAAQDAALGRLFAELRKRGVLDRSIVVVTSDHGEEFAEHGHLGHGNGLHFPSIHVPLIVRYPPRIAPGERDSTPVSLRDVPQTILELANVNEPGIGGTSLMPLIVGDEPPDSLSPVLAELYWVPNQPSRYPVSAGNMRSIVHNWMHLIERTNGPPELYDIRTDPWEETNLAMHPEMDSTLRSLRELLAAFPMDDREGR